MAEKKFVYIAKKASFSEDLQKKYNLSIVFIADTNEIFTHGVFFGLPSTYKTKIDSLESAMNALKCFASVSDGEHTATAPSKTGILTFKASNGMSVVVNTDGVTLKGTDLKESATNGNITVVGPGGEKEVKVHGLGSAAFSNTDAFATPASVSAVDTKAIKAQGDIDAHKTDKENPHSVTKAQVGLGSVENLSRAQILANAALTGNPTAPTQGGSDNSTKIATTAFVKTAISSGIAGLTNALVFKGTLGTGGTVEKLPESPKVGDVYITAVAGTYAGVYCEVGDMVVCTVAKVEETSAEWKVVQANITGALTSSTNLIADQLVVGASSKAAKPLAAGADGQILKISGGKPVWGTAYKAAVTPGTDGSLTIDGKKYSVGKPATAGTADQVGHGLTISLNGTAQNKFTGASDIAFNITAASIGAAAASHSHVGTAVTLTGYSKPGNRTAIAATDNVNVAIGKLEAGLDLLEWEEIE